jgi:alanine-synthesizing transaminase
MSEEFYRIKRLPPYVIAEVNAMRAAARAAGRTSSTSAWAIPICRRRRMSSKSCAKWRRSPTRMAIRVQGHSRLRKRTGELLWPPLRRGCRSETEVVVTMGSKEGLASLAHRDHRARRRRAGAQPELPDPHLRLHHRRRDDPLVPTTPDENYFDARTRDGVHRAAPVDPVVNYPSNPTAETVDLAFYERLVAWAKENKVWVLSDLAYSELYYDGNPTPSILQVPGAKDVAVEFTSMSKTYSMAGWRIGFAVGNKR